VACGGEGSFGVVEELDAVGGEVLNDGFDDVIDFVLPLRSVATGGRLKTTISLRDPLCSVRAWVVDSGRLSLVGG
jgi:hypothetical protein